MLTARVTMEDYNMRLYGERECVGQLKTLLGT